jgi:hypothetical protein
LNKKRSSVSIKIIDTETNETLKKIAIQLEDGEGCFDEILIPKDWESKTIKAMVECQENY